MENPMCARKGAYEVEVEKGKEYYWCACGRSKSQPFCDGSHKGTGFKPKVFTVEFTGRFEICGCKQSKIKPFCDGTHEKIDVSHLAT